MKRFSGTIDYYKTVKLDSVSGSEILKFNNILHTARLYVNNQFAGERMWPPFNFEIGKFLKNGENQIRVEVSNMLMNEISSYDSLGYKDVDKRILKPSDKELESGIIGNAYIVK